MIGVIGGRLAVQGLTVGLVNGKLTFTNTTARKDDQPPGTEVAESLQPRDVVVNGSLMLSLLGQELLWPATQLQVRRTLAWTYSNYLRAFTASVALSGEVMVAVLGQGPGVWLAEHGREQLNCTLAGQAVLSSNTKPGPGLSGNYSWVGELALLPDPWAYFGETTQDSSMKGRRQVLQGFASSGDQKHSGGRGVLQANTSGVQHASLQPVSGDIHVKEHGTVAAAMVAGDKGSDGLRWLDSEGQVVVAGYVPEVPPPQQEQVADPVVFHFIPLWAWLALAAAFLLLLCSVLFCWLVLLRKQRAGRRGEVSQVSVEPVAGGADVGSLGGGSRHASKRAPSGVGPAERVELPGISQPHARRRGEVRATDISLGGASGRLTASSGGRGRAALSQDDLPARTEWWETQDGAAAVPATPPDFEQPPSLWQQRYGGRESLPPSRSNQEAPPSEYARRSTGTGSTHARRSTGTGSSVGGSGQVRRQAWGPA